MSHRTDTYGRKDWASGDPLTNTYFRSEGSHAFTTAQNLGTFDATGVTFIAIHTIGNNSAPYQFKFEWLTAIIGGAVIDTDLVVCDQQFANKGLLAVKGPAVTITLSQNSGAVNNAATWLMQFMRVGGIARALNADDIPCHMSYQSVGAATTITTVPNPQFWGDAMLWAGSESTDWTFTIRTFDLAGATKDLQRVRLAAQGYVTHRISIPSKRWDLQITNNLGVAKNIGATIMPTQGP